MSMNSTKKLLAGMLTIAAGSAQADVISFTDNTGIGSAVINEAFSLGLFDSNLGVLTSIEFEANYNLSATGRAENEDPSPVTITLDAFATNLNMSLPSDIQGTTGVFTNDSVSDSVIFNAAPYDGTTDFGGASGISGVALSGSINTLLTSLASELAAYSQAGGGTFGLNLTGFGASTATGGPNITSNFVSNTTADVRITYTYDPRQPPTDMPTPGPLALMAAGLFGLGGLRRLKN